MRGSPLPRPLLREILATDVPRAFRDLVWAQEEDTYFVEFPALRADGTVDRYLTKWTFTFYPEQPPHVTFVNPTTRRYDGSSWPDASNDRVTLHPVYAGAPEGLICNSMFYDWYYYGGHSSRPDMVWRPRVHTAVATVAELRTLLRQPYYNGPRRAGS